MEPMTAEQAAEWGKTLDFPTVWATIQELAKERRESQQETDRKFQAMSQEADKRHEETEQQMKETARIVKELSEKADKRHEETEQQMKETGRLIKELSKNNGGVNRSFGRFMEEVYSARIWDKFTELGYEFTTGCRNKKFKEDRQTIAEADIFLENGLFAMLVEIKVDLTMEDIDEHIERITTIRDYLDRHGDKRTLVGAIAGGIAPENMVNYAQKKGLYVVVWSGDAAAVVAEAPPTFKAREWGAL
jgi:hypothetical protein